MGILITSADFIGKYKISTNSFQADKLNDFITQYEQKYLYNLLGKELADLFIADLVAKVPVTSRFTDIYNAINLNLYNQIHESDGMKDMVLGFIYFEWMRKMPINATITGAERSINENSTNAGQLFDIYGRYNDAVNDYKTIQLFILDDLATYPEFLGVEKDFSHWSI